MLSILLFKEKGSFINFCLYFRKKNKKKKKTKTKTKKTVIV
jgi:hypothetical protein